MASHITQRRINNRLARKNPHGKTLDTPNAYTLGELLNNLTSVTQLVQSAIESEGRDAPVSSSLKRLIDVVVGGETVPDTTVKRMSSGLLCAECRYAVHNCQCHTGRYKAVVGQSYQTQSGDMITVLGRSDESWGYETLICSDGRHRYDRSYHHEDAGRVTGTDHDYSCPDNIKWDVFTPIVAEEG